MKAKRKIAWLLSFLMVFSLIMGTSKMQVFAAGGAEETATFVIREANGQTGTVQYKLNGGGDFITANNDTSVGLEGVTSITIKVTPTGEAQVNQTNSGISGTERTETFDYDALITESGWTYNIQDNDGNITFTIEFDNNDGTGGGSNPGGGENPGENAASYSVDFGEGSWIVGDVTVTANKSGEQTLSESDIITLTGFDAETMEARVDAEDGFWTTLAVTDGQTSISAHTNDGGVPTDIAFSVVEKSSNPGGGGEMPGGNSDGVKIQINNISTGANGTVMYKFDTDAEFTSVTSTQADAGGNILVAIPGEATSITIKAVPNDDYTVRRGGCRLYVDDENIINEDNINTYYDALIGDGYEFSLNEGLPVFVVEFGEPEIDLWYAISWGGGNVTVENGQIMYHRVYVGDVTYTTIPEEVNESSNIYAINTIEGDMEACLRTYGVAIVGGTDLFVMPDVSDVYVDFVLVPDYGYQVTDIITNETESLLNEFNPIEQISTYKFEYITNTNVHFNVMFSETEDIINVGSGNTNITGGAISGGENIIDTGNLQMDVDEVDKNTVSNTIKEEVGDFDAIFLNIDLNQIVSKGAGRGNWTTPLTELENEVTISLDVAGYDSNKSYYIVREHDGTCDRLEATYNTTTGKLEFATDRFSTYAIICTDEQTPGGEDENVYYIDFGAGPWTVGDVTVSAPEDMSDVVPMLVTDTISTEMLANFDPDTMDAVLIVDENVTLRLNVDENGNTRLADVDGGVEVLPPSGAMIFSVVKKTVDNEEFETESYTLTDDKGNVISLTYEKNRELSFTMIDYLAFSPEDLETAGISQEFYDSAMKGIKNATKQHGTLLSFYEIQVENDDGFLIHEGPFYIKIKMTDEMKKYDIFKIVYIDAEDNFATESPITLTQEGGYLVGTLEHLSTYALVGDNAPGENDAPADSDTSAPTSPQTGDNSNLGLWVFLLVLSSCSMIALIVIDKKRKIAK